MASPLCPVTLDTIVAALCDQCGLTSDQYDVSRLTGIQVLGYTLGQRGTGQAALDPLLSITQVDQCEYDGAIHYIPRGQAVVGVVDAGDLGAVLWQGDQSAGADGSRQPAGFVATKRLQDLELPFQVDLTYFSVATDYQQATQSALRISKQYLQNPLTINTSLSATDDDARQMAETELYRQWIERQQFTFSLPPRYLAYAPTDVIELPLDAANTARVRVTRVDLPVFGPLSFEAVLDDLDVLSQVVPAASPPLLFQGEAVTASTFVAWSGNALRDADADTIGFYAVAAGSAPGDWPGIVLYWSRDGGQSYTVLDEIAQAAPLGTVETALPVGVTTGYWDTTSTVVASLPANDVLESTDDASVLAGANAALIGNEVIQFVNAVLLSSNPNRYLLSRLLRGRRGTDGHWKEHVAGERFVLLDKAWVHREVTPDDLFGKAVLLAAVMPGEALQNVPPVTLTVSGDERKCYAPTDIGGNYDASQNLTITWIRRTRKGGEMTDLVDVPLAEAAELYDVEIMNSSSPTALVERTFAGLTTPSVVYTATQQTQDFGSVPAEVTVRVYQIGQYGRGYPGGATLAEAAGQASTGGTAMLLT